jgi:glycosyltransferase involved in cell wall biosynthesis
MPSGDCSMTIDVLICTFNRSQRLKKALESLLGVKVPNGHRLRIIVVNNNSSDNTEQVIRSLQGTVEIVYVFEARQGKSYALNAGLLLISGEVVAFTDDDVIVDENWFLEIVCAAEKYPKYECFGSKVVGVYPARLPDWLDVTGKMSFLRTPLIDFAGRDQDGPFEDGQTPGGGSMFFRRAAVEENGPFRTDLGPRGRKLGFSEDVEYCHRFLSRGKRFMYVCQAIVYHPVHAERLQKPYLLNWQFRCGRYEARRIQGTRSSPMLLGAPRYLFRQVAEHAAGWAFSRTSKDRFYNRLRLYYRAGELFEHIVLRLS